MKNPGILLLGLCLGMPAIPAPSQDKGGRVEVLKPQDLKRTAHRLRISVERLANARAALREATDLALRLDPPVLSDYGSLARLWNQLDRKSARERIGLMVAQLSRNAQAAEDSDTFIQRYFRAARATKRSPSQKNTSSQRLPLCVR